MQIGRPRRRASAAAGDRTGRRRGRPGVRLSTSLVGVVLLPVLALTALATETSVHRAETARAAAVLEGDAATLAALARFGFRVADEQSVAETKVAIAQFWVGPGDAEAKVGFDVAARWRELPGLTDAGLANLPPAPWLAEVRRDLRRARTALAAARPAVADLGPYTAVQAAVERAALDVLDRIERGGDELTDGEGVNGAGERLRAAYGALGVATGEVAAYFAVYLSGDDQYAARQQLAGAHRLCSAYLAELHRRNAATLGAAWQAVIADPAAAEFERMVDRLLTTPPDAVPPVSDVDDEAFPTGHRRVELYRRLVEAGIDDIISQAAARAQRAQAGLRWAITGSVLIGLLTLLGAWLVARTIARPLHALAERAGQVNRGDLDVPPAPERGVREVVAVTRVFNDLVGNLRLLGRQADALASGDLTDGALAMQLPGALGRSLHGSVERLSASMAAREELAERLRHEATHDGLTGLLNRAAAMISLQRALGRARRTGEQLVVLVIDVDGLTKVNARHGQRGADQVLLGCATRLAAVARDSDTVARLDSDEFVLIADVPDATAALALAERIRAVAAEPIPAAEASLQVTVSVGLAVTLDTTETADTLLRDADAAVRRAKAGGGNRVEVFDAELRGRLAEQDTIERALARALEADLLELHYQPVVATGTGELVGFEALCRWTDPELGAVSPATFIPAAERSDLVLALDGWVLRRATRQLAAWQRQWGLDVHIAVNVSGRHLLRGDIVGEVRRALAESGLRPADLVLEITETVLLTDLLRAADALTALRALGVKVAIDDFGTGYTSIAHLRQLPVDILKIDRSLVSRVEDTRDALLVSLLVQTARTLGLGLVAEGAEKASQLSQLRDIGCENVQGYFVSRPMPVSATDEWIRTHRPVRTTA